MIDYDWLDMINMFFWRLFQQHWRKGLGFSRLGFFTTLGSLVLVVYLDLLLHIGHKNVVPMVDLAWQKMRWVGKSVEDPAQCHFRSECFCALKHWLFRNQLFFGESQKSLSSLMLGEALDQVFVRWVLVWRVKMWQAFLLIIPNE